MNQKIKIKILGCGSSTGAPLPGCSCKTCLSKDPKNSRSRASIFVEYDGRKILIDAGQDLRWQMLAHSLTYFDLVLYTHEHNDHINGSNDLVFSLINTKEPLKIFGTKEVIKKLLTNFDHLFRPTRNPNFNKDGGYDGLEKKASLIPNILENYDEIQLQTAKIRCFEQDHGFIKSTGFEFGNGKFVYSPDLKFLPERTIEFLKSLKIDFWIVPLTHIGGNNSHISLEELQKLIEIVRPKRVILIHMNHALEYYEMKEMFKNSEIPIEPAFDGMELEI